VKAIAIATTEAKCLPVLIASITFYVPDDVVVYLSGSQIILPRHRTINLDNVQTNFGDAYNAVVKRAFEEHEEVLVCNDDIVFTPYTYETLKEDISVIRKNVDNLGWVATRSDYARGYQNIRHGDGPMSFFRYETEDKIIETDVIAPICGYVHRDSWIDFPPINWYSDDIQCLDMQAKGMRHFISRAYVHHVGSQTCGKNAMQCVNDAKPWIEENRPELAKLWFKTNSNNV
jgi:hypothetical protein